MLGNCLFIPREAGEIFYDDDILICASNVELLESLKNEFKKNFEMKDLGEVSRYLELKITQDEEIIKVDLKRFYTLNRNDEVCTTHRWIET